jgi:hypothetical protein
MLVNGKMLLSVIGVLKMDLEENNSPNFEDSEKFEKSDNSDDTILHHASNNFFHSMFRVKFFLSSLLKNKNIANSVFLDDLDLNSIIYKDTTSIDEKLGMFYGDVQFTINKLGDKLPRTMHIFFEHQSTSDKFMSLRLLNYVTNSLMRDLRNSNTDTYVPPLPISIVLYNGTETWKEILPLSKIFGSGDDFKEFWLFPLIFINLSTINFDNIEASSVKFILKALYESKYSINRLVIEDLFSIFRSITNTADAKMFVKTFKPIFRFLLSSIKINKEEDIMEAIERNLVNSIGQNEGKKLFTSVYDALKDEWTKETQRKLEETQRKLEEEQRKREEEQRKREEEQRKREDEQRKREEMQCNLDNQQSIAVKSLLKEGKNFEQISKMLEISLDDVEKYKTYRKRS